jgi:hypothetical protein
MANVFPQSPSGICPPYLETRDSGRHDHSIEPAVGKHHLPEHRRNAGPVSDVAGKTYRGPAIAEAGSATPIPEPYFATISAAVAWAEASSNPQTMWAPSATSR